MSKVRLSKTDFAYHLTLADPPLHILDIALLEEMRELLRGIENDRALLIIDAEGEKAFSAGASVQDHAPDRVERMLHAFHDCFRFLHRLDLVTVALVKGVALGGGCELALACDFILASDSAKFGQPEITLGVFPPVAAWQLSRQMVPRRGLELLVTGDSFTADEALRLGLINAVFLKTEFDASADAWLQRIVRHSASTVRMTKRAFRIASADDFEEKLAATERFYLEELMRTDDANEGLNAFLEKRKAVWKGF